MNTRKVIVANDILTKGVTRIELRIRKVIFGNDIISMRLRLKRKDVTLT
jgi:hypothetical protein